MTLGRSIFTHFAKRHNFLRSTHIFQSMHSMAVTQPENDMNPLFCYTSGQWLWNEREQLEARYRHFGVPSLQQVACQAIDASRCTFFEKIGEGNYNKAYRLVMEDGQKAIAKVPQPNAGPRVLATSSEVASMEFARTVLNIPVPKVLAWSAIEQNHVRAEYIITEEARGSQLHEVWQSLPLRTKSDIIRELVEAKKKLISISFNRYDKASSTRKFAAGWANMFGKDWIAVLQG